MKNLQNKTLTLFFTRGISLKKWLELGNLEREIKPYNELAKLFKKIYFITYGKQEERQFQKELAENIKVLPNITPLPPLIYQLLIPLIYRKELKETDIYKTNQMAAIIPALFAKWLYKKFLVLRCGYEWLKFQKRNWKKPIVYFIEKIGYKSADRVILTSQGDKVFVEKKFGIVPRKIEVIPNYIDTDIFKPLPLKKEKNRIIFIGRLSAQKNLFNLIKAVAKTSLKLVIIGSGPLEKDLKVFARHKSARVEFKGNIPNQELPQELNKSVLFILPSFYEGCPKALLEAMSCGLPCIGTNVDGTKEIIEHKKNGYLCQTDGDSLKKAMMEVLANKKLQEKLGKNARQTILEQFSLEKILEQEKNIYEAL